MTAEEQIDAIRIKTSGIHPFGMTELELQIRDIVWDTKSTAEEKKRARCNTEALEFAEFDDED